MAWRNGLRMRLRIAGCHTISHYEQIAGIGQDQASRLRFWQKFRNEESKIVLDAGIDTLLHLIKYRISKRKLTLVFRVNGKYQPLN
jgi:hypothetical protein